jgi:hypothetical protein
VQDCKSELAQNLWSALNTVGIPRVQLRKRQMLRTRHFKYRGQFSRQVESFFCLISKPKEGDILSTGFTGHKQKKLVQRIEEKNSLRESKVFMIPKTHDSCSKNKLQKLRSWDQKHSSFPPPRRRLLN